MAAPNKISALSGVRPRSFLLTALVLILVVSLFFIPEIIRFQKSFTGLGAKEGGEVPSEPSEKIEEHALGEKAPSGSPLEKISGLIDSGYIDQMKARKLLGSERTGTQLPPGVKENKLSWDSLKSRASLEALRQAARDAQSLAKALPKDKVATRYALYNFVSGVRLVSEGNADKSMSPEDAVHYLEFLQSAVSSTMLREGVDRSDYNKWVSVSLGPIMDESKALRMVQQRLPFNPHLTLTRVTVRKAAGYKGEFRPRAPVYVQFVGYVSGKDIKKMELYLNDVLIVKKIAVRGPDETGRRFFKPRQFPGVGYYTFRIYDQTGQIYQKTYTFFPRAGRFPWHRGVFELPFKPDEDPRVDRFFTYRGGHILGATTEVAQEGSAITRF